MEELLSDVKTFSRIIAHQIQQMDHQLVGEELDHYQMGEELRPLSEGGGAKIAVSVS